MKILVCSDSHDHKVNMAAVIQIAKDRAIETALHLGDFTAPPIVTMLGESNLQWYCVWGNCDGDKLGAYRKVENLDHVDLTDGDFRELELDGKKLFLTHYPRIAQIAASTGDFDAVFYGHDHTYHQEIIGKTLLANPGEVTSNKTGTPSCAIYDTADNSFEVIWL